MRSMAREQETRRARIARDVGKMSRRTTYFTLMGTCILLILVAWNVVRFYSITASVVMSMVALVIPPVAVIAANRTRGR